MIEITEKQRRVLAEFLESMEPYVSRGDDEVFRYRSGWWSMERFGVVRWFVDELYREIREDRVPVLQMRFSDMLERQRMEYEDK